MCGVSQVSCPPHRWAVLEEYGNIVKYICKDCRVISIRMEEDKNGKNKELGKKD